MSVEKGFDGPNGRGNLSSITPVLTFWGSQVAVSISGIRGWDFWLDIAEFCEKAPESFTAICDELDFSRLDE